MHNTYSDTFVFAYISGESVKLVHFCGRKALGTELRGRSVFHSVTFPMFIFFYYVHIQLFD